MVKLLTKSTAFFLLTASAVLGCSDEKIEVPKKITKTIEVTRVDVGNDSADAGVSGTIRCPRVSRIAADRSAEVFCSISGFSEQAEGEDANGPQIHIAHNCQAKDDGGQASISKTVPTQVSNIYSFSLAAAELPSAGCLAKIIFNANPAGLEPGSLGRRRALVNFIPPAKGSSAPPGKKELSTESNEGTTDLDKVSVSPLVNGARAKSGAFSYSCTNATSPASCDDHISIGPDGVVTFIPIPTDADALDPGDYSFIISIASPWSFFSGTQIEAVLRIKEPGRASCLAANDRPTGSLSCPKLISVSSEGVGNSSASCSIDGYNDPEGADPVYSVISNKCGGNVSIKPSTGELLFSGIELDINSSCSFRVAYGDGCQRAAGRTSLVRLIRGAGDIIVSGVEMDELNCSASIPFALDKTGNPKITGSSLTVNGAVSNGATVTTTGHIGIIDLPVNTAGTSSFTLALKDATGGTTRKSFDINLASTIPEQEVISEFTTATLRYKEGGGGPSDYDYIELDVGIEDLPTKASLKGYRSLVGPGDVLTVASDNGSTAGIWLQAKVKRIKSIGSDPRSRTINIRYEIDANEIKSSSLSEWYSSGSSFKERKVAFNAPKIFLGSALSSPAATPFAEAVDTGVATSVAVVKSGLANDKNNYLRLGASSEPDLAILADKFTDGETYTLRLSKLSESFWAESLSARQPDPTTMDHSIGEAWISLTVGKENTNLTRAESGIHYIWLQTSDAVKIGSVSIEPQSATDSTVAFTGDLGFSARLDSSHPSSSYTGLTVYRGSILPGQAAVIVSTPSGVCGVKIAVPESLALNKPRIGTSSGRIGGTLTADTLRPYHWEVLNDQGEWGSIAGASANLDLSVDVSLAHKSIRIAYEKVLVGNVGGAYTTAYSDSIVVPNTPPQFSSWSCDHLGEFPQKTGPRGNLEGAVICNAENFSDADGDELKVEVIRESDGVTDCFGDGLLANHEAKNNFINFSSSRSLTAGVEKCDLRIKLSDGYDGVVAVTSQGIVEAGDPLAPGPPLNFGVASTDNDGNSGTTSDGLRFGITYDPTYDDDYQEIFIVGGDSEPTCAGKERVDDFNNGSGSFKKSLPKNISANGGESSATVSVDNLGTGRTVVSKLCLYAGDTAAGEPVFTETNPQTSTTNVDVICGLKNGGQGLSGIVTSSLSWISLSFAGIKGYASNGTKHSNYPIACSNKGDAPASPSITIDILNNSCGNIGNGSVSGHVKPIVPRTCPSGFGICIRRTAGSVPDPYNEILNFSNSKPLKKFNIRTPINSALACSLQVAASDANGNIVSNTQTIQLSPSGGNQSRLRGSGVLEFGTSLNTFSLGIGTGAVISVPPVSSSGSFLSGFGFNIDVGQLNCGLCKVGAVDRPAACSSCP